MLTYTKLTGSVARGPRALQCRLYPKTSNQVNSVLHANLPDLFYEQIGKPESQPYVHENTDTSI